MSLNEQTTTNLNKHFSKEQKIAFVFITLTFGLIWSIAFNDLKNNDFNYAFCLNLAGMFIGLQCFFYTINKVSKDLVTKNWFSVGLETALCVAQVVMLIIGMRQLSINADPFLPSLYLTYALVLFFAQIYISKHLKLLPTSIFCIVFVALMAGILKSITVYTPENYTRLLIWVGCSYGTLAICVISFFVVIKQVVNSLEG
jgi:hypothetical protein